MPNSLSSLLRPDFSGQTRPDFSVASRWSSDHDERSHCSLKCCGESRSGLGTGQKKAHATLCVELLCGCQIQIGNRNPLGTLIQNEEIPAGNHVALYLHLTTVAKHQNCWRTGLF